MDNVPGCPFLKDEEGSVKPDVNTPEVLVEMTIAKQYIRSNNWFSMLENHEGSQPIPVPNGGACWGPGYGICWQQGTVGPEGQTGAQVSDIISACIVRLLFFQESTFSCEENNRTIILLKGALKAQIERDIDRKERGVEGKHEV